MKKFVIVAGIVAAVILSISFYIHTSYLFNPISFKKDDVAVHNWSFYRHPLVMEISNISDSWKTTTVSNREDIKFIYNELQSGKKALENASVSESGTYFAITIRSKATTGSNTLIDQFNGYIDGIVHINNGQKIYITDRLNKYIREVIGQ